ncbi:transcription termination/antitermination NusG family protein [Pedobacter steynii]
MVYRLYLSQSGEKIYNELTKKNIKAYLPLQNVIRQWSDRKKEIKIPMFPNYVFINSTERSALIY